MSDVLSDRFHGLGREYDKMMRQASVERCNCMVRYNGGPQLPARKDGKAFFSPEDDELAKPDSFEMMKPREIARLMKANNEIYIGHMFRP